MKLLNYFLFTAIFAFLAVFFLGEKTSYDYVFLLPLSVFILTLFFKRTLLLYNNSIVYYLVLLQISFRYLLLPILIAKGGIMTAGNYTSYGEETIFFMMIEVLSVYLVLAINAYKHKKVIQNNAPIQEFIEPNFILIIILGLTFSYIYLSGYFYKVNYIWELRNYIENKADFDNDSALAGILFYPLRVIISLLFFSLIYTSRLKRNFKILFVLGIIALNSVIIVGTSRFRILFNILPLFFISYIVFNKIKMYITIGLISILIPVIVISTLAKFKTDYQDSHNTFLTSTATLNAYFSGPGNVSTGLELYFSEEPWNNTSFLYNDLFQNVPIMSKYTDNKFKTNIFFNEKIYGHRLYQDQIVPLSLNGLIHFGLIGVFIYPMFFIWLALVFERKFFKAKFIDRKSVV